MSPGLSPAQSRRKDPSPTTRPLRARGFSIRKSHSLLGHFPSRMTFVHAENAPISQRGYPSGRPLRPFRPPTAQAVEDPTRQSPTTKIHRIMGYAVLHLDKASGNEAKMTAHIERTQMPANAVSMLTYLNEELIEFPAGVTDRTAAIQHRLDTAGITRKIGTNQVRAIRIMLTGSNAEMKRIEAEGRIKEWCADNLDWLCKTYGADNLVSAVLHRDEATPHIHATIVPIVTGERRKANEEKPGKKRYRKKLTTQPRLCADDVMTRVKLKAYQDSYAEVMSKYGLERGIVGSEARHITTQEFYRNAIAQQQNLQDNIAELLKIEEQKRQVVEQFTQQEREARYDYKQAAELKAQKEAELKTVKDQLKTEKFKSAAAEAGSAIMDGISSVLGTSKVKRQEQEIAELRGEIAGQKRENTALKKEVDALKSTIEQQTDESAKVSQGLRSEIAHLHDLMPELEELLRIEKVCKAVRFSTELTRQILRRESVGFKGSLYSPEHEKWLKTDHSTARIEPSTQNEGRLRLMVDGISISRWLKLKHEEQYPRPQVKEPQRQNRGMGVK